MSLTDYRKMVDTHSFGSVTIECSDAEHINLGIVFPGTSTAVELDANETRKLCHALLEALGHITPTMLDGNLDRRPN